jgi:hypothetical protein
MSQWHCTEHLFEIDSKSFAARLKSTELQSLRHTQTLLTNCIRQLQPRLISYLVTSGACTPTRKMWSAIQLQGVRGVRLAARDLMTILAADRQSSSPSIALRFHDEGPGCRAAHHPHLTSRYLRREKRKGIRAWFVGEDELIDMGSWCVVMRKYSNHSLS